MPYSFVTDGWAVGDWVHLVDPDGLVQYIAKVTKVETTALGLRLRYTNSGLFTVGEDVILRHYLVSSWNLTKIREDDIPLIVLQHSDL